MGKVLYTSATLTDAARAILLAWFREVVGPTLAKEIAHHTTIAFKPASVEGFAEGSPVTLRVVGFAHDERGQAVLVSGVESSNAHPHVTVATAEGTKPVYSNELLARGVTPIDGPTLDAVLTVNRAA